MNALAPAVRMAAGALLLLLLLPLASAQAPVPTSDPASNFLAISVVCPDSLLEPAYAGQDTADCTVQDLSRDSLIIPGTTGGTSVSSHLVTLQLVPVNESVNATGWNAYVTRPVIPMYGGDTVPFSIVMQALPSVNTQDYAFELVATYQGPNNYTQVVRLPFHAEVNNYDFALPRVLNAIQKAGQDEVVTYQLAIQNVGVYPDVYRISVSAPDDIHFTQPANVYVPPGETRIVNISFLTPHGKIYEIGRSTSILFKISSTTGTGVYSGVGVLQIRGPYIPVYWVPLLLVGIASAVVVGRGSRERAELRRLEAGRPRRVEPTPRQAVLLAELRRRDKDAYNAKAGALDAVYKERVGDYRAHRKEREAADREEAKRAHAEYVAAKKARKAQKAEERRQAKVDAKERKRLAKIERKELKVKEKELKATRKKVEKARKKADKIAAKDAKIQAKADAKQAKLDAAAAKNAEKEAKKAAKAAKKRGGEP